MWYKRKRQENPAINKHYCYIIQRNKTYLFSKDVLPCSTYRFPFWKSTSSFFPKIISYLALNLLMSTLRYVSPFPAPLIKTSLKKKKAIYSKIIFQNASFNLILPGLGQYLLFKDLFTLIFTVMESQLRQVFLFSAKRMCSYS